MFGEENRENRTAYILFLAAMAVAAVLILWSGNRRFEVWSEEMAQNAVPVNFSDGWTLILDGEEQGVISVPYKVDAAPGNAVTLRRALPAAEEVEYAISFHTAASSVEAKVGDRLIYRYDTATVRPLGKAAPNHWNIIQIPADCAGQTLTLTIISPYRNSSGVLSPIWIGPPFRLMAYLMRQYIPQMMSCGVFLVLGAAIFASSFYLRRILVDVCTVRCLGIFVMLSSIWMMSQVEFPDFIWEHGFSLAMTRHLMAMVCPLPYLFYLMHRFPKKYQPVFRKLCYLFAANFFLVTVFQMTDIADFMEVEWTTHICLTIMFFTVLFTILDRFRTERPVSVYFKLECVGITLISMSVGVEIWMYYQMEYMKSGDYLRGGLFAYIVCLFVALLMDTQSRREEALRLGRELQDSRLRLMISQIQPHFIYNTLSSVRTLIKLDPDRAYDLVYDFSKYLRANIDSIGQAGMIPFSEELEHIKNYCNIEKVRFGDRLSVVYKIETDRFDVPPLTVQPLVENAIKHGLRRKSGAGTVMVRTYEEENGCAVEVLDDGVGFDTDAPVPEHSAGLGNIRFRLHEIAGAGLTISSIPGKGTRAVVHLPGREIEEIKKANDGERGKKT